jgi:hypothetical protein
MPGHPLHRRLIITPYIYMSMFPVPSGSSLSIKTTHRPAHTCRLHLQTTLENGVHRMLRAEYLLCMDYHAGVAAGIRLSTLGVFKVTL